MPTIVIFIALALILAIVLAYIVVLPWARERKSAGKKIDNSHNQMMALNVEVFKDRINELKADYANKEMSKEAFITQKTELERQLLQASSSGSSVSNIHTYDKNQGNGDALIQNEVTSYHKTSGLKKMMMTLLVCIPLLIALIYIIAEKRTPVWDLWTAQDEVGQVADDLLTGKIDTPPEWATTDNIALINAIQTNVHHNAHDPQRWMRLSDIYLAFKADNQALEAISRAYRIAPTDETIAVRYAQTQFFVNGGILNSDGRNALQYVLDRNPEHQGAQMLMVMGEARSGNYEGAQKWIDKLRDGITSKEGDHSQALQSLDELSENIRRQQKASATDQAPHSDKSQKNSANITHLKASVKINSSLIPLIEASDVLFVSVQEEAGGPPLAVKRLPANQFLKAEDNTLEVNLSDEDAMMGALTLSSGVESGKRLVVTARVSKTGQAMSESGDLSSDRMPLDYSNSQNNIEVAIEINQQVP